MIHKTEYYPNTLSLGATIISDGESPDMAKYIVDYFEYIYEHR